MVRKFYVLEGVDGSGKSTQIELIKTHLEENYKDYRIVILREPGITNLGTNIRNILLNAEYDICNPSEILLFYASRFQMIEEISKYTEEKIIFLCDRFTHSSLVYQGVDYVSFRLLNVLNEIVYEKIRPDLFILLDIDDKIIEIRNQDKYLDRMESKNNLKDIASRYRKFWDTNLKSYKSINANGDIESIKQEIINYIEQNLRGE